MKHKNIYRISISLLLAFVMALPTIAQNTKTFKGVVLDETEQPIIGAAIKVVGTTVGTITDLDGNFTLNVPDGKEVEISYIGYVTRTLTNPRYALSRPASHGCSFVNGARKVNVCFAAASFSFALIIS